MKTNTIIWILIGGGVLVGGIAYAVWKKGKNESPKVPDPGSPIVPGTNSGTTYTPPPPSIINKMAYAKYDGTKVYKIVDGYLSPALYKTAQKDEWVGRVKEIKYGTSVIMDHKVYATMNNLYFK